MRLEMLVFRLVLLVSWFDYVNAGQTSEMRVTWEVWGPRPPPTMTDWYIAKPGSLRYCLITDIYIIRPDYESFNETSWIVSYTVSSAWLTARSSVKKRLLACLSSLDDAKWVWSTIFMRFARNYYLLAKGLQCSVLCCYVRTLVNQSDRRYNTYQLVAKELWLRKQTSPSGSVRLLP